MPTGSNGGVPLASKLDRLNGPDWRDVATAAREYAEQWNGCVTIVLSPYGSEKDPRWTVEARVYADRKAVGVAKPLGSSSVNCGQIGVGDIPAAALSALYELDKEMYRREIGISHIRA
jgi:hypothetical protein